MFEPYIICDDSLENVNTEGKPVGFRYQARLNYYRGIPLSMVDDITVLVDGEAVDRNRIRFSVDEDWFTLDEMETVTSVKWEYGRKATIFVEKEGGLAAGAHTLSVTQIVRTPYIPFPLTASLSKVLKVEGGLAL